MRKTNARLATTTVSMEDYLGPSPPFSPSLKSKAVIEAAHKRVRTLGDHFEQAWRQKADFVASYESITWGGRYALDPDAREAFDALVETVPGPITDYFGQLARRHRGYCAISLDERDGDRVYNTAVLIDRNGAVAGKYRKVHIPPQERIYTTPGDSFPVFETDFGRVGFSICYDIMFPETARCLAMNGADLLVHIGNTTYNLQEASVRVRAADNQLWVLTCNHVEGHSMIVDPLGNIIAQGSPFTGPIVCADVNLDAARPLPADNALAGVRSLRGRMCHERVPAAYQVLTQSEPPLLKRYSDDRLPDTPEQLEAIRRASEPKLRQKAAELQARTDQMMQP